MITTTMTERVHFIVKCSCSPRIFDTLIIFVHDDDDDDDDHNDDDDDDSFDDVLVRWTVSQLSLVISNLNSLRRCCLCISVMLIHF